MYDALLQVRPKIDARAQVLLPELGVKPQNYVLVTVHRAANTDDPSVLRNIASALKRLELPVIFSHSPAYTRLSGAL